MKKVKQLICIVTILSFFLLFSSLKAIAEDVSGNTPASPENAGTVVESTSVTTPDPGTQSSGELPSPVPSSEIPATEASSSDSPSSPTPAADTPSSDVEEQATPSIYDTPVATPSSDIPGTATPGSDTPIFDAPATDTPATDAPATDAPATDAPDESDNSTLIIVLPTEFTITLDPLELIGKGQIYSDSYKFTNYGDTTALLTFTDIEVSFPNDKDFEALAVPYDKKSESPLKAIYLTMNFNRPDVSPIVLTDFSESDQVTVPMSALKNDVDGSSSFSISFSGNLNDTPAVEWVTGDVKIKVIYTLESINSDIEFDSADFETTDMDWGDLSDFVDDTVPTLIESSPTPTPTLTPIPPELEQPSATPAGTDPVNDTTGAAVIIEPPLKDDS